MKVGKPDAERVIVRVLKSTRITEGKRKGAIKYEIFESFDVYDAKPEQVYTVAYDAIRKA